MSTPPIPVRPPRKPINLTTVITVFALIFGLAFGICSVSGISLSNGGDPRSAYKLIATASVMGGICVACLMAIAVVAFIRSRGKT
jgi:amino acid transporter